MKQHAQGSTVVVGAIAGGVGFVAFVALVGLGGFAVSPSIFLAVVIAIIVAMALLLGLMGRGDEDRPEPGPTASAVRPEGRGGDRPAPGSTVLARSAGGATATAGTSGARLSVDAAQTGPAGTAAADDAVGGPATAATAGGGMRPHETAMPVVARKGAEAGSVDAAQEPAPTGPEAPARGAAAVAPAAPLAQAPAGDRPGIDATRPVGEEAAPDVGIAEAGAADRTAPAGTAPEASTSEPSQLEGAPGPDADASVTEATPCASDAPGPEEIVDIGTEPRRLAEPRAEGADDLKKIKGVGPKLETMLNRMGFYHFDQIAEWSQHEVAWVDENLKGFKGRVSRDNWVSQAGILAEGGETDFSRRVGGGAA